MKKLPLREQNALIPLVANKLNQLTQRKYIAARIGTTEFVVVYYSKQGKPAMDKIAEHLIDEMRQPIFINNKKIQLQTNIGIALYNRYCSFSSEDLLFHADVARIKAAQNNANTYEYFDIETELRRLEFNERIKSLRKAIQSDELELFYQPKCNLETGLVIGVEALLRWRHPTLGLLTPDDFLYDLDDQPISLELGDWVINTILKFSEALIRKNIVMPISVNVSSYQLQHPDFMKQLEYKLARHPTVPNKMIMIEILETETIKNLTLVSEIITAAGAKGIMFALDDFGTGYSSLTYLKALRTHQVKLDQSFIRNILINPEDIAILKTTIELCGFFGRELIAEGVETITHIRLLKFLGCSLVQGYAIAKPMPAEELIPWLINFKLDFKEKVNVFSKDACDAVISDLFTHYGEIKKVNQFLPVQSENRTRDEKKCPVHKWFHQYEKEFNDPDVFKKLTKMHRLTHQKGDELMNLAPSVKPSKVYIKLKELDELDALFIKELYTILF